MIEDLPWYKSEDHYKPEQDPDTFTVADWLLNTHQGINRVDAEDDITRAHIQLRYVRDSLASLAGALAERDPTLGREIIDAAHADPQHDYGEIDYRAEQALAVSSSKPQPPPQPADQS